MRLFALCLAALALGACGQGESASAGCALSAAHEVRWSATAPDVITARAEGPTCAQAVVTLTMRNAQGDPLWAFASTYVAMKYGDAPPEGAAATQAEMEQFLAGWADVTLSRTTALPAWRAEAATLSESASTFAYDTPFERDVYEMLRTRDLPMLCYAATVESTQCLIVDPASNTPALMAAYGP
jgi:hypothetical protein